MAEGMKLAYLFSGTDAAKLDAAVSRLRGRAEREGGAGALETFAGGPGSGPDAEALVGSIPAISLMAERRYLLADGVERWKAAQVKLLAAALPRAPEEVTVVLVARGKPPKGLAEAVEGCGGELFNFDAPGRRELPGWLVGVARERGFKLAPQAARALVARVGESTVRLANELDRIELWAGEHGEVGVEEIEELTVDESERAGWTLGDAIVARDPAGAVGAADALLAQGEAITPMIYGMASRLRSAHQAAASLEAGRPARQVEAEVPMAPYPSKMLVRSVQGTDPGELSRAIETIAELEWWTRGGSDYDQETAMVIAVRRASGGGEG